MIHLSLKQTGVYFRFGNFPKATTNTQAQLVFVIVALLNRELKEKESAGLEAKSTNTPPVRIFVPRRLHVTSEPPCSTPFAFGETLLHQQNPMVVCHGKKFRTSVMMVLIPVEIGQPPSQLASQSKPKRSPAERGRAPQLRFHVENHQPKPQIAFS